jgi:glycerophosphoryl diester phosphodiesterase
VDVKHVGCEAALLDGLRRARLLDRSLLSSQVPAVLDRLREREPRVRLGISVGGRVARFSRRWGDWRAHVLSGLASRRWDALMAQHRLVDAALLEHVITRDGRLYAWTVNERAAIQSLRGLGVHGIATADPRLFTPVTLAASP